MGVWDLKHLHQEIKKWKKLSERKDISEGDRSFYLSRLAEAEAAYAREARAFEERSTIFKDEKSSEDAS